jgi:putative exporter of polyketide antibiotics
MARIYSEATMTTGLLLIAAGLALLFCARAAHEVTGEMNRWLMRQQWRGFPRVRSWMLRVEPFATAAGTALGVGVGIAAIVYGIVLTIRA